MEYSEKINGNENDSVTLLNVDEDDLRNLFELYNANKFTTDDKEYLREAQKLIEYIIRERISSDNSIDLSYSDLINKLTDSDIKNIMSEFIYLYGGSELLGGRRKNKELESTKFPAYFLLGLAAVLTHQPDIVHLVLAHELSTYALDKAIYLLEIYKKPERN